MKRKWLGTLRLLIVISTIVRLTKSTGDISMGTSSSSIGTVPICSFNGGLC